MLYAFDLLELNGKDLRPLPLGERKSKLAKLLAGAAAGIVFNEHTSENGATVFEHACRFGFEGIVSKRLSAPYRSGPSRDWIKVKNPDSPAMIRAREGRWRSARRFRNIIGTRNPASKALGGGPGRHLLALGSFSTVASPFEIGTRNAWDSYLRGVVPPSAVLWTVLTCEVHCTQTRKSRCLADFPGNYSSSGRSRVDSFNFKAARLSRAEGRHP
jgi:hypothetical protein